MGNTIIITDLNAKLWVHLHTIVSMRTWIESGNERILLSPHVPKRVVIRRFPQMSLQAGKQTRSLPTLQQDPPPVRDIQNKNEPVQDLLG